MVLPNSQRQKHEAQSITVRAHPSHKLRAAVARHHELIARLGVWPKIDQQVGAVPMREDEVV
jgi:hypothetical protein